MVDDIDRHDMTGVVQRFYVIDAMRCVLALCVVLGHVGIFPLFGSGTLPDPLLDLAARGLRTIVFGPPAVIAFFVISGFCIHYPFTNHKQLPVLKFYARRYIRILAPIVCLVVLAKIALADIVVFGPDSVIWHSTLWSVVCEEIYYALYPLLFLLARRVDWLYLVGAAFCASLVTIAYTYPAADWSEIGIFATTTILFPVWLLGCYLAANIRTLITKCSTASIWLWRAAAWFVMWLELVFHFHTNIHQTVSGLFIGVVYFFWLRAEISYYQGQVRVPWRPLAWAGRWSYSLYLVHPFVAAGFRQYGLIAFDTRMGWLIGLSAILIISYGFYLAFERPSHRFARRMFPIEKASVAESYMEPRN